MRTYNNKQVFGMEDWTGDFSQQFKSGDLFDSEIAEYFCDCLPPRCWSGDFLQAGEPHSHVKNEKGEFKATYATFKKIYTEKDGYFDDSDVWEYLGHCFAHEEIDRG